MSTLRARFGKTVRRLRLAAKPREISQERFALLAGINRSYMGRIERGEVNASLDLIERISKAFRISSVNCSPRLIKSSNVFSRNQLDSATPHRIAASMTVPEPASATL